MLKLRKWVNRGEKKVNHKQKERKKVSPDEEERRKEFVCWMMEPVRKQKTWRTSMTETGNDETTKEEDRAGGNRSDDQGEQTAMDTSESEEEPRRKVRLKRQRSPARGNWKEKLVLGEKGENT